MAVKEAAARVLSLQIDGLVPLPVAVAAPTAYRAFTGQEVAADEFHLLARLAGGRPPMLHKAFAGTAGACTAVAASIHGTIPHAVLPSQRETDLVVIGHPSGLMQTRARVSGPPWVVERAGYSRTARRLMEGYAYVRTALLARGAAPSAEVSVAGRR